MPSLLFTSSSRMCNYSQYWSALFLYIISLSLLSQISPSGAAAATGKLGIGDKILKVSTCTCTLLLCYMCLLVCHRTVFSSSLSSTLPLCSFSFSFFFPGQWSQHGACWPQWGCGLDGISNWQHLSPCAPWTTSWGTEGETHITHTHTHTQHTHTHTHAHNLLVHVYMYIILVTYNLHVQYMSCTVTYMLFLLFSGGDNSERSPWETWHQYQRRWQSIDRQPFWPWGWGHLHIKGVCGKQHRFKILLYQVQNSYCMTRNIHLAKSLWISLIG